MSAYLLFKHMFNLLKLLRPTSMRCLPCPVPRATLALYDFGLWIRLSEANTHPKMQVNLFPCNISHLLNRRDHPSTTCYIFNLTVACK